MNPKDFQIKKKTFVVSFTRGVTINDIASELTVDISLNNLKGLFTIKPRINYNQVTGDDELDGATVETVGDLVQEAISYGLKWRREWEEANEKSDPDQMKLSFGNKIGFDEEEEKPVKGSKAKRS